MKKSIVREISCDDVGSCHSALNLEIKTLLGLNNDQFGIGVSHIQNNHIIEVEVYDETSEKPTCNNAVISKVKNPDMSKIE